VRRDALQVTFFRHTLYNPVSAEQINELFKLGFLHAELSANSLSVMAAVQQLEKARNSLSGESSRQPKTSRPSFDDQGFTCRHYSKASSKLRK
jgi:hypothetical protein